MKNKSLEGKCICGEVKYKITDKPLFTQCLITNSFKNSSLSNEIKEEEADAEIDISEVSNNEVEKKIEIETENTHTDLSGISQSTNLFSDIKEKSDEEETSVIAQDLSNNIIKEKVLDLETNPEQDISENSIESIKDISNNTSTTNNLEKAHTDISQNEITIDLEPLEKRQELHEIDIKFDEANDSISLKNPNEVYIEIYKEAKKRAKQAKKLAIEAYLEAKRIKSVYLLDQFDSESDSESEFDDDELILSEEQ